MNLDSKTPESAEMPTKRVKTQQDHNWPHRVDGINFDNDECKTGPKRLKDKGAHCHGAAGVPCET